MTGHGEAMDAKADEFFDIIEEVVQSTERSLRNRIFSSFRDFPWTPDQREELNRILHDELDMMINNLLGSFDNIGGVLPEHHPGYLICRDEEPLSDIRSSTDDYATLWWEYVQTK